MPPPPKNSTERLVILADDFTGACDAAAPLGDALVVLSHDADLTHHTLAIDLDLREEGSDFVASEVTERAVLAVPAERVFVKIDSTLRGPLYGLVRGALAGTRKAVAVIAPAFPEQGRIFRDGRLVLNGVPGASLLDVFADAVVVAPDAAAIASADGPYVVVDVERAEQFQALADAWRCHPEWLLVGSGGLSRHLAPAGSRARPLVDDLSEGPLLVVAGSPTDITRQQLERIAPLSEIMLLRTPPTSERDSGESALRLADDVHALSRHLRPRALVLAGGATARAVCHRLGVHAVRLVGEIGPGIPVGYLVGGDWEGLPVVTKAGGFGTPETLLDVSRALGVSSSPSHDAD